MSDLDGAKPDEVTIQPVAVKLGKVTGLWYNSRVDEFTKDACLGKGGSER